MSRVQLFSGVSQCKSQFHPAESSKVYEQDVGGDAPDSCHTGSLHVVMVTARTHEAELVSEPPLLGDPVDSHP